MAEPTAAGILFVHDGKVLLLKRSQSAQDAPGTWGFPGGGIEDGETPEEAARREYGEECGDEPYAGELTPLYTSSDGFQCFGATGYAEPQLNDEHTDWGWFGFDDLPTPLHPGMKEIKMPLIQGKSNEARSENIRRELEANPDMDPKQAEAIAYSVQRHARDGARDEFLQAVDAIHQCAMDCMAYDRKRK